MKIKLWILSFIIIGYFVNCPSSNQREENRKKERTAALLLASMQPYDPDQALIDAIDADIIAPGPLNMDVKRFSVNGDLYLGKTNNVTVNINSDYDAKNVLIYFMFVHKSEVETQSTAQNERAFTILDRVPYIHKGERSYTFTLTLPNGGEPGQYYIFTQLDPENNRQKMFDPGKTLGGVKIDSSINPVLNLRGDHLGSIDLAIGTTWLRKDVVPIYSAQTYTNTEIFLTGEAWSYGGNASNVPISFYFSDTNGNKLPSLGSLLVRDGEGNLSSTIVISEIQVDRRQNFDVTLVPDSPASLTAIQNYIQTNGGNLKVTAEINPTKSVSEVNAPDGTTSNIVHADVTLLVDSEVRVVLEPRNTGAHGNLNSAPIWEKSMSYDTGVLGDRNLFAVQGGFSALGRITRGGRLFGRADAGARIYMFSIINRKIFEAYAQAEVIPVRLNTSYVDVEAKALQLDGSLGVVYKKYETANRTFYWYTTKYKDKEIKKKIYPFGVPVTLTGKIAGIILSKDKVQLADCTILSCKPVEVIEERSAFTERTTGQLNSRYANNDFSIGRLDVKSNLNFTLDPRVLLRGFGDAFVDLVLIGAGVEGQLTILDIFPIGKATGTFGFANNAKSMTVTFNETLDIYAEWLYGKVEVFVGWRYPKCKVWFVGMNCWIAEDRKYWGLVSWDKAGSYRRRLLDQRQVVEFNFITQGFTFR